MHHLLLALSCQVARVEPTSVEPPPIAAVPAPEPPPAPPEIVRLVAVGDVLPHRRVKASAKARGWPAVFGDAAALLRGADLAFANLEGPIAPDHDGGVYDEVFNAPATLAPGLSEVGIDVVSMANNHAFDQGPLGLVETWTRVREAGVRPFGAAPSCDAAYAPEIIEVRGVKIALLGLTDLVNLDRNAAPEDPCLAVAGPVCASDCGPDRDAVQFSHDLPRMLASVKAARREADFVVLSFHWGIEYDTTPLPEYPPLAAALTDAGVDVLLGHHPHVLQPVVVREASDSRKSVIAYSLGNFVSNMGQSLDPKVAAPSKGHVRDGLLLEVSLVKHPDGRTEVSDPVSHPLWTENKDAPDGSPAITVRALSELLREDETLARARWAEISRVVGPSVAAIPEHTPPLEEEARAQ